MTGQLTFFADNTITQNTGTEIITYRFAGFGARFAARIIDVLIILLPSLLIPIIPSWLYWSLQQSSYSQATVGQKVLGIKVISLDGTPISFGQATGRFFSNLLNALTLLIGYFLFFFSDKNQCLHDMISGCIVVSVVNIEPIGGQATTTQQPIV